MSCFNPPFVAAYAGLFGNANSAFKLVILIIELDLVFFKNSKSALITWKGALRFTSYVFSQSESGYNNELLGNVIPALFTKISIVWKYFET